MSESSIKVYADDLQLGMYVQGLDRPWLDSPFLFQGFLLDSDEVLQQVKDTCEFVFISPEQSTGEIQPRLQLLATQPTTKRTTTTSPKTATQFPDEGREDFRAALRRSRKSYDNTRNYIDVALEDVRLGNAIDTKQAKSLVADLTENIVRSRNAMIWLTHLKNRDEYTALHCINVCILSISFGTCLNLNKTELNELGLGSLLHDLGKMRIPLEVLNKPGKLTEDEFSKMKQHPLIGYELLSQSEDIPPTSLNIIKYHHERKHGNGYPDGLCEEDIPLFTQIAAIVDVYDAITSDRCYHDSMTPYDALNNMYRWAKNDFNLDLVEQFIKCLGIYPIGSLVSLSTNEVAVVISANEKARLRPIVLLIQDRERNYYNTRQLMNLANPRWSEGPNAIKIQEILHPTEHNIDVRRIIEEECRPL